MNAQPAVSAEFRVQYDGDPAFRQCVDDFVARGRSSDEACTIALGLKCRFVDGSDRTQESLDAKEEFDAYKAVMDAIAGRRPVPRLARSRCSFLLMGDTTSRAMVRIRSDEEIQKNS